MNKTDIPVTARERELRAQAEELLKKAQADGRELTEEEERSFSLMQDQIKEARANALRIEERLSRLTAVKQIRQQNGVKPFRLLDAVNAVVNNRSMDDSCLATLEEGREQMRASGQSFSGQIQIPCREKRALNGVITAKDSYVANTTNGGLEAVATDTWDIVGALRGNLALAQAGATFLSGLVGNVEIPLYSGSNVAWGTETSPAPNGTGTFGSKTMSPKRLTTFVDVSKQFLIQTSTAAEMMLRDDIAQAMAAELEKALLTITPVANAPAPVADWSNPVTQPSMWYELIADLENANYWRDFSVVLNPRLKAALRSVMVTENRALFEDGQVDGLPTFVTSNAENYRGFVGVFRELVIGQWGGLDIVVDPYTVAAQGKVRIVANGYFDACLRRDGAIATFSNKDE